MALELVAASVCSVRPGDGGFWAFALKEWSRRKELSPKSEVDKDQC